MANPTEAQLLEKVRALEGYILRVDLEKGKATLLIELPDHTQVYLRLQAHAVIDFEADGSNKVHPELRVGMSRPRGVSDGASASGQ